MTRTAFVTIAVILFAIFLAEKRTPATIALADPPFQSPGNAKNDHGIFTGDVKIVFYVSDVRESVEFYRDALGFTFHHYHDYSNGKSVTKWTRTDPPIYAEMSYADRRFGIHRPTSPQDERCVGTAKVYFRVKDLETQHRRIMAWNGKPSTIRKKPWMDMFHVVDPDGHRIYFAYTNDTIHGNPWYGS